MSVAVVIYFIKCFHKNELKCILSKILSVNKEKLKENKKIGNKNLMVLIIALTRLIKILSVLLVRNDVDAKTNGSFDGVLYKY